MAMDDVETEKAIAETGAFHDEISCSSTFEAFTDEAEVRAIIGRLEDIYGDPLAVEANTERFGFLVDKYQEQPHLLDPHLNDLLMQLLNKMTDNTMTPALKHLRFKLLYKITKVRGFKTIIRHLPHEVVDLEPVMSLLSAQDPHHRETWETRYMLLLWLSIIVMIPFHLTRLDSNEAGGKKPIMQRILDIGKFYLGMKDKPQDAAAYLVSRFLTRPDVKEVHLKSFIEWALDGVSSCECTMTSRVGELLALTFLFKNGKREDLLPFAAHILGKLQEKDFKRCSNMALRKLAVKLTQRLGMTFLKPRIAAWRYQRGSRSLEANLKSGTASPIIGNDIRESETEKAEDEEDFDVPEEVESVIHELLSGLKDKENIIRWSAAKGIGRVTSRLPKELADEVVASVLEMFTQRETDSAWHGGCLALAELGRRGLLLPERLDDVVPVILKALVYDEQKGSYSVGDHIRDAGCYVCWAFARAYDPQELKPFVNHIAQALLITTVFDREIHCRRAASAAFQENVGRQGTFPHGIDILTTADFFAVGNRNNAFLNLSVYVAQFPEYTLSLIEHLLKHKISHWDVAIRELTSLAFHNLTPKAPEFMAKTVLPQLLTMAVGIDLNARHGAILCIGEIIHALYLIHSSKLVTVIGEDSIELVKNLIPTLQERKLLRGLGGELMRKAACRLVERASLSKLPFHDTATIDIWQNFIDDCLQHSEIKVFAPAVLALRHLCIEYYLQENGTVQQEKQHLLLSNYVSQLRSTAERTRMGFCMALGSLPDFILAGKLTTILPAIIACTAITDKDVNWAKARTEAVHALAAICVTVGVTSGVGCEDDVITTKHLTAILECFLSCLKDYTVDSCGDIGSHVRKAAMTGLYSVISLVVKQDPQLITPEISRKTMCGIAQQAVEKIEKIRATAGSIFFSFVHSDPELPHLPDKEQLKQIFPYDECQAIKWSRPAETFCRFAQMLRLPEYRYYVSLGFAISAGGLTEHLVKDTMSSLSQFFRSPENKTKESLTQICNLFLKILSDHQTVTRVSLPVIRTIDQLLSSGNFDSVLQDPENAFPVELFKLVKTEVQNCSDPTKILAGISLLCNLLQCPTECSKSVIAYMCIMLCHRYPRIRKDAATKLFTAFVEFENLVPEVASFDEASAILTETDWGAAVEQLRPLRNRLCDLLQVPRPKIVKK